MKWTLLYFDDEIRNIDCFRELLNDRFDVIGCHDLAWTAEALAKYRPHLVMIDVHMPTMDGHALYRQIASSPEYNGCPVVFISSDVTGENRLRSHLSGGQDFLSREMDPQEVETRLVSKIRLYHKTASKLSLGNLLMDFEALRVFINDRQVDLTLIEMRILACILRNCSESLTRDDFLRKIWGIDTDIKPGTINVHISNFKSKLLEWDHTVQIKNEHVIVVCKN